MAVKKRGLGRGLNALLGSAAEINQITNPDVATATPDGLKTLPVDIIQRGRYQPRVHFEPEALQELADSIKAQGIVQPVVVRPVSEGHYELIAGERRWRAAQLAGLSEIPAVIKDLDDKATAAVSLIENIQRENLNPLEESRALQRLCNEFSLTHQQIADTVGRSRTAVTNLLRLQELNEDVKQLVDERRLDMGHARALLAVVGTDQSHLTMKVANKGLSVRETEQLVKKFLNPAPKPVQRGLDPDVRKLQDELSERLGASVEIHANGKKGKLSISYNSLDELEGILEKIR